MRVVAFFGSPRKGGNTELLLMEAIKGVGLEVEVFDLSRMRIAPCENCGGCDETGRCIIEDDMAGVAEAIRGADRVILASPIFFFGISAQAKAMIDRCQQFWCEKYLLKRPIPPGPHGRKGLFICVGGMKKEEGVRCSETTARAFFRTISVPEHETVSFLGIDAKGAVLDHPEALAATFEAGRRLL
ncbi:MAG: flavodoxin family protein [Thermodesulfovibrionales bacterium]